MSLVPDGAALFDQLRERVTKVLDDIIAKADDQTRDTKQTFLIPGAIGIVGVLNERAHLLDPDIATVKLFEMLRKRNYSPLISERRGRGGRRRRHGGTRIGQPARASRSAWRAERPCSRPVAMTDKASA